MTRTASKKPAVAPPIVDDVLRTPGRPLDPATREQMEARLGHDFRDVRVHADATSAESAAAVQANAYTVGRDVVFGANRFAPHTDAGARLLAHELTHVIQQRHAHRAPGQPIPIGDVDTRHEHEADAHAAMSTVDAPLVQRQPVTQTQPQPQTLTTDPPCYQPGTTPPVLPGGCNAREPARCATFEQWMLSFQNIRTTRDRITGDQYLGDAPASAADPAPATRDPHPGDHFVDHATNRWLTHCLPSNLVATACMLPSDCADIAVILRHVWLAAHHRSEQHGRWQLGDAAGGARQESMRGTLRDVSSWNVNQLMNAYTDSRGRVMRSWREVGPLLHPGDVLLLRHRGRGGRGGAHGGHTVTIARIERFGSTTTLHVLQGNLPIFAEHEPAIRAVDPRHPPMPQLQNAPGRRIETDTITVSGSPDVRLGGADVWLMEDGVTTLDAAGPIAATRPRARGRRRSITDWTPSLRTAPNRAALLARFESMLLELRSLVERGDAAASTDAPAVVRAAGEALARMRTSSADRDHDNAVARMSAILTSLASPTGAAATPPTSVQTLFTTLQTTFAAAANETAH